MYEGAATKMYLPLSPLYRQLLFIFTLCSQSHVFFPALCTSEPGLLQYTHAMKSPKPENAPFEGQHFKLLHSLLKTTQVCQDLLFFFFFLPAILFFLQDNSDKKGIWFCARVRPLQLFVLTSVMLTWLHLPLVGLPCV